MQITEWIFRGAGMIVAVVMLIWFVMPAFIDVWNVGNVVGIICCVWLFVITCKPLQHAVRELCGHGLALGIYRAVNGVFIAFLAYGLIVTCVMILAANAQPEPGATALVLGAHVHKSGSPSSILYGRLRAAEKYLADNPDSAAVLSGGKGVNEPISEAQCMYNVLTEDGFDGARLFMEDRSTNTAENFRYSFEVIGENGLNENITVVTDGFHQLRARIFYMMQGGKGRLGAASAPTRLDLLPCYVVREWVALPSVFFR